jgi:hypothetical protein
MPSFVTPKKNTEYIFYISLTSQADVKLFQINPTLAAGDVKVSTDGGAEGNIATLPVVTPAGSKRVKVTVSASEMNGDNTQITFSDAAGAEWADKTINIQTTREPLDEILRIVEAVAGFVRHGIGISWPLGIPFYVDPVNGSDGNDGLTKASPKLTFAAALALCTAENHDSIIIINTTGAPLVWDAKIDINKAKVHVIGDGNITIKPTSVGAATVILSALGAHIEGLNIETHTTGNENAIEITANECEAHNFNIPQSRGSGCVINGANDCIIHNFTMSNQGSGGNGNGVQITGSSERNNIHDFIIVGSAGDGINFNGANVSENIVSAGDGTSIIHECTGWGIQEEGDADDNEIVGGANMLIEDNTAGRTSLGPNTVELNTTQYSRFSDLPANFSDMVITVTTGLVDITQTAADKVWSTAVRTLSTAGVKAIWDQLTSGLTTPGSIGKLIIDNLNATISSIAALLPAALVGGRMSSDVGSISTSTEAADKLEASAKTIVTGAAIAGTLTNTKMSTDLTEVTDDHYNGRRLIWTSGALKDQATAITDYDGTNKILTFVTVTDVPSIGDSFNIV